MTTEHSPSAVTVPTSTYRLQVRPGLRLDDVADLVEYLAELGVDAVYLSPILASTPGSDHGYDCTDPSIVDDQRGGEAGWATFMAAARRVGLKVVLDIVPNHLGIAVPAQNPAWWSVLRSGRQSPYADWFDIDWDRAPILVPVLGDEVSPDDLQLVATPDGGEIHYFEHRFPVAAGTWADGDTVAEVLARQHYRLAGWRSANDELNYRRFFAVTTLAGVRQEDPAVFAATHERIRRFVTEDGVEGLRVDHPDGLTDPGDYLRRLRELAPTAWITIEKILEPEETLPDWPIQGTTGYDAMAEVNGVFLDPAKEAAVTAAYRQLTGDTRDIGEHVVAGKDMVLHTLFGAELTRLTRLLPSLPADQARRDLIDIAAWFEVYRTYLPFGYEWLDEATRDEIAVHQEDAASSDAVVDYLVDPTAEVAQRFQQLTGAAMAKGKEDTAYYRYNRFVALNEVGGNPGRFGYAPEDFHAAQQRRQELWPQSMTALSTHDTKRGEDVRARLAVLAELGPQFLAWARDFAEHTEIPNLALAYLLAQTFAGVGLIEPDRMHAYAEKAMREAADGTGWVDPDPDFEAAVHAAVDRVYADQNLQDSLQRLLILMVQPGWSNALGQKLVQLTMPGIPDVYQGTELWEDSLVDPDNRRPVDFAARRELLTLTDAPWVEETGKAKFWVVRQALTLRRERPELFASYTPVRATGEAAQHFLGFDRGGAITAVTRLPYTLGTRGDCGGAGCWGDTTVELVGTWRDELTGTEHSGTVAVSRLFGRLPVALLVRLD
ncbi:malto-oligosyltrehalose synthase [Granulicoccus phenolivorans]|uniref:malto-oligosyltrehalose synthase n=1 Tax=Granulicoccus phenolivorans TaxID=266854 RepID=UPI0004231B66|nr:malto-oligosyltrehalose synthase [Granulicoccus phenolivorans]